MVTFIGLIGGFLTTVAFLPQVVKIWRTKSTKDLSLVTFALQLAAVTLWSAYGLILKDPPIILWNIISAILTSIIVIFKLKYK